MFSLLLRIVRCAHKHPWAILALTLAVSALCVYPVTRLRWELRILDALPQNSATKQANDAVEKKFGGFGTLTVVIESKDSAKNANFVRTLAAKIQHDPLVNYVEYESDVDFYRQNKLLYIQRSDLELIQKRVRELTERYALESNPLFVNLIETDPAADSLDKILQDSLSFDDLEKKYLGKLRDSYSSEDGTIRVLDVYPAKNISDLSASRALLHHVSDAIRKIPGSADIRTYYTGKVYAAADTGRTLLPEVRKTGIACAVILFLTLLLRFYRQPQIALFAAVPIAMTVLWTLAAAGVLYGRINLFTLMLALILPGLGSQLTTHIMSRYADERRKGLSPEISLESALLCIGPAITVSAAICAATFLSLTLVPLAGVREFGTLGAIGSALNCALCCLVLPALLLITQRKKPFAILERKHRIEFSDIQEHPYTGYRKLWIPVIAITLILAIRGFLPVFDYNYSHTEMTSPSAKADSLLAHTDYTLYDPAVVLLPDAHSSITFAKAINDESRRNPSTTIRSVVTYADLLPANQKEKLALINDIKAELHPELIKKLRPADSANLKKIMDSWDVTPISEDDLPESLRHKFEGRDGTIGEFAFIFPDIDPDDGLACRRFARELRSVQFPEGTEYKFTGTAIVRADLLDETLPYLRKSIIVGIVAIAILLLLFYNKLSLTLFTLASPCVAFLWLLSLMRLLGIEISAYSALAFPLLIGMSLDGSIQLWNAYYEKSTGSLHYITHTTGVTVAIAQALTLIGIYGFLISSHPGLRSIGLVSVLGLLCMTVSHCLLFPLIAGYLDSRRFRIREQGIRNK